MTSERWRRIERLYEAASQRAPNERGRFLDTACEGDETLRADVERLLAADDRAGDFLNAPAWEGAARALAATKTSSGRAMPLVGAHIGPYDVLAPLGVGGMGEVYRARDTTLNRDVALKVLPDAFALDADRVARFRREANVLASLNHPNVAAIYGFEEAGEVKALVLELVEGPTLADRIAGNRLPLEGAWPIARQLADALEAAHERGIVHRDLKPANIKVRPDGVVKVLDFGLAKVVDVQDAVATNEGLIIGSAAYMAPEQARGKPADKRADMWAFGCVLYEMLTGRRVFAGQDSSETLAAVIKNDPDWGALPDETPPSIRRLLRRCLVKDPKGRLSDAAMARIEIDEASSTDGDVPAPGTSRRVERVAWVAALAASLGVAVTMWAFRPTPQSDEIRVEINTPPTADPLSLAISPDGRKIVFVESFEGRSRLVLRTLNSGTAVPLA